MVDKKEIENIKQWIRSYLTSSHANGVVLGMSGGKDSLVTAKLCADALGKHKVLGIIMPNGDMKDNKVAIESCKLLGIRYYEINIKNIYDLSIYNIREVLERENRQLSTVTTYNIPPRLRMSTLYSIAGSLGYLVANTSNLSETMVGYTTKWGDNVGDFGVLANFTKEEVCQLGILLGLPPHLVNKAPDDGLTGKSDEDKLGFKYKSLDDFIRKGLKSEEHDKIMAMHKSSQHKRIGVVKYQSNLTNFFEDEKE